MNSVETIEAAEAATQKKVSKPSIDSKSASAIAGVGTSIVIGIFISFAELSKTSFGPATVFTSVLVAAVVYFYFSSLWRTYNEVFEGELSKILELNRKTEIDRE